MNEHAEPTPRRATIEDLLTHFAHEVRTHADLTARDLDRIATSATETANALRVLTRAERITRDHLWAIEQAAFGSAMRHVLTTTHHPNYAQAVARFEGATLATRYVPRTTAAPELTPQEDTNR